MLTATNDGLTTYRRVGGVAGATLLPNLAESLPSPSDGGRTYAFTLRQGVRFSTGGPVRATDVKRGIERSMKDADSPAGSLLSAIASITADDARRTVVFRLKRPDPDFRYLLALPFASAVPPGTPAAPTIVAATGPYRIAAYEPRGRIRLERNRYFRQWSALARPDGYPDVIDVRLGVKANEAIGAVRAGRRDVAHMTSAVPEMARLRRRDPGPIRDTALLATSWVFLNTRVPPFNNVNARRAVSLAIDRRAIAAAAGPPCGARVGSSRPAFPATGRPARRGPDLAAARRLVARSGTRGARVTLWTEEGFAQVTPLVARALRSIGYDTRVRLLPFVRHGALVSDSRTRAQVGLWAWQADYPATSTFLGHFSCRSFVPHSVANLNHSQFCDPRADDLMRRAAEQQTSDLRAADALWARAEDRVLAEAPVVPLLNLLPTDLVSTRVRNDQNHPFWGSLLDQMSVR